MDFLPDIKQSVIAPYFTDTQQQILADMAEQHIVHKNNTIFYEYSKQERLYLCAEGKVIIERRSFRNMQISPTLVYSVQRGNIFGEMGYIDRHYSSATARAKSRVRLLTFDYESLNVLFENDRDFGFRFMQAISTQLARRLRRMNNKWLRQFYHPSFFAYHGFHKDAS